MKKVLIVDDASDCRLMIKGMLNNQGFGIIEADNGFDGWKKILVERPDLIFLDLHMPNKNGFEILKDLEEEWMGIPVVVVSGDSTQNAIDSCFMYGASAYLHKPINKQAFVDALKVLD
ncbi:response regulator [Labilibacter marinus]|uniref:response regulator n=1 Tax=Labilibacter marinus TaxID=1477105 RepID=UPI00094FBCAA|nr:response regulator [Labilibacter marinus]